MMRDKRTTGTFAIQYNYVLNAAALEYAKCRCDRASEEIEHLSGLDIAPIVAHILRTVKCRDGAGQQPVHRLALNTAVVLGLLHCQVASVHYYSWSPNNDVEIALLINNLF